MDYLAEAAALLKLAEGIYGAVERLIAAGKANGDPTSQEVTDAQARAQAANDRIHALLEN